MGQLTEHLLCDVSSRDMLMSSSDFPQIISLVTDVFSKLFITGRSKTSKARSDQKMEFYAASHDRQRAELGKHSLGECLTLLKIPLRLSTHLLTHTEHAVLPRMD